MRRLDTADLGRIGRFLADTRPVGDDEPFPRSFLAELRRLVPATRSPSPSSTGCASSSSGMSTIRPTTGPMADVTYWDVRDEHPVCSRHEQTGRLPGSPSLRLRRPGAAAELADLRGVVPAPARRARAERRSRRTPVAHEGVPLLAVGRARLQRSRLCRPRRSSSASRRAVRALAGAPPSCGRPSTGGVRGGRDRRARRSGSTGRRPPSPPRVLLERYFGRTGGELPQPVSAWLRRRYRRRPDRERGRRHAGRAPGRRGVAPRGAGAGSLPDPAGSARSSTSSPRERRTVRSPSSSGSRAAPCAATSRTRTPSSASTRGRPPSAPSRATGSTAGPPARPP